MKLGKRGIFTTERVEITCEGKTFWVNTVESIKICGVVFSNNVEIAYECNVTDKINKLKKKLNVWYFRGLSPGGKILVTKTFGVSQLIYTMQACKYKESDLKNIESFIFTFLWNKHANGNKAPERIKRITLKQDYEKGGLKVTDAEGLNAALKTRQFFRASKSNHPIKSIQQWLTENLGYDYSINQEYSKFVRLEDVVNTSQNTLNTLTDRVREEVENDIREDNVTPAFKINLIAATDIIEYLNRKKLLLVKSFYKPLFNRGIENYKQLVVEALYPRSDNNGRIAKLVLSGFPESWKSLIESNIECNASFDLRNFIPICGSNPGNITECTVAKIKNRLLADNMVPKHPFELKLGLSPWEGINPFITARRVNHSTNMRIFKFRLLHMDIFTKERMSRFKMCTSSNCDHCGELEDVKHVLWDCDRAKKVWQCFKTILGSVGIDNWLEFANIFIGYNPTQNVIEAIITRISQFLLQPDRSNPLEESVIKFEILLLAMKHVEIKMNESQKDLWIKIVNKLKTLA